MKKLLMVVPMALLGATMSYAQYTATATLAVTVGPEASIVVNSSPAFSTSTTFADYTSTTTLTYKVRTTAAGTGNVTVYVSTDFSAGGSGGGPSVLTPPNAGDALTYTCTAGSPVTGTTTPCATAQTATTVAGSATNVVSFAHSTQSDKAGDAITTSWDLTNDPSYKAGSYNAVATYTISAT
jgi:hypothetical protein